MDQSHMAAEDAPSPNQHCVTLNVFSPKLVPEPIKGVHEIKSKIVVEAVTTTAWREGRRLRRKLLKSHPPLLHSGRGGPFHTPFLTLDFSNLLRDCIFNCFLKISFMG